MVKVKNTSDQPQALWWGHTAFDINPGETIELEPVIVEACLKHPEYRPMFDSGIFVIEDGAEQVSVPPQPPQAVNPPVSSVGPNPWDGTDWDPLTATLAELVDYCKLKGLSFDPAMAEDDWRAAVDEHYLSNE